LAHAVVAEPASGTPSEFWRYNVSTERFDYVPLGTGATNTASAQKTSVVQAG